MTKEFDILYIERKIKMKKKLLSIIDVSGYFNLPVGTIIVYYYLHNGSPLYFDTYTMKYSNTYEQCIIDLYKIIESEE